MRHTNNRYWILQVLYAVREYACTAIDIIARRTRLAFCNVHAAEEALPRIIKIMAQELKWSSKQQEVRKNLPGPEVIKLFFMLNATEHEIFPAHIC